MMPNRMTVNNALYWGFHEPLTVREYFVLRRIEGEVQAFDAQRFDVAHLIARKCVIADLEKRTLSLTEKGRDALDFYSSKDGSAFLQRVAE